VAALPLNVDAAHKLLGRVLQPLSFWVRPADLWR